MRKERCEGSNIAQPVTGFGGSKCPVCNQPIHNLTATDQVIGEHSRPVDAIR